MTSPTGRFRIIAKRHEDKEGGAKLTPQYYCGVTPTNGGWYPSTVDATRFLSKERASELLVQLPMPENAYELEVEPCQ